jgi:hypothetical protein
VLAPPDWLSRTSPWLNQARRRSSSSRIWRRRPEFCAEHRWRRFPGSPGGGCRIRSFNVHECRTSLHGELTSRNCHGRPVRSGQVIRGPQSPFPQPRASRLVGIDRHRHVPPGLGSRPQGSRHLPGSGGIAGGSAQNIAGAIYRALRDPRLRLDCIAPRIHRASLREAPVGSDGHRRGCAGVGWEREGGPGSRAGDPGVGSSRPRLGGQQSGESSSAAFGRPTELAARVPRALPRGLGILWGIVSLQRCRQRCNESAGRPGKPAAAFVLVLPGREAALAPSQGIRPGPRRDDL